MLLLDRETGCLCKASSKASTLYKNAEAGCHLR